jgi:hypothetical protein
VSKSGKLIKRVSPGRRVAGVHGSFVGGMPVNNQRREVETGKFFMEWRDVMTSAFTLLNFPGASMLVC